MDDWIMKHIGMDADELLRLKQISGLASLFTNRDFSRSWEHDGTTPELGLIKFEDEEENDTAMASNFF